MSLNVNEEYTRVDDNFEFAGTGPDDETQEDEIGEDEFDDEDDEEEEEGE